MITMAAKNVDQVGSLIRYKGYLLLVVSKEEGTIVVADRYDNRELVPPDTTIEFIGYPHKVIQLLGLLDIDTAIATTYSPI